MHACLFKILKKQPNGAAWKKDSLKAYDKKSIFYYLFIYLFVYSFYLFRFYFKLTKWNSYKNSEAMYSLTFQKYWNLIEVNYLYNNKNKLYIIIYILSEADLGLLQHPRWSA